MIINNKKSSSILEWVEPKLSTKLKDNILTNNISFIKKFIQVSYKQFLIYFIFIVFIGLILSWNLIPLLGLSLLASLILTIIVYIFSLLSFWLSSINIVFSSSSILIKTGEKVLNKYPYKQIEYCILKGGIYNNKKFQALVISTISNSNNAYFIPEGINLDVIKNIFKKNNIKYTIENIDRNFSNESIIKKDREFKYPLKLKISILIMLSILLIFFLICFYVIFFIPESINNQILIFSFPSLIILSFFLIILYFFYFEFLSLKLDQNSLIYKLPFKSEKRITWSSIKELKLENSKLFGEVLQVFISSSSKPLKIRSDLEGYFLVCEKIKKHTGKNIQ